jgi:hypothetical protein
VVRFTNVSRGKVPGKTCEKRMINNNNKKNNNNSSSSSNNNSFVVCDRNITYIPVVIYLIFVPSFVNVEAR